MSKLIASSAIALPSLVSAWSLGGSQLNADTVMYSVMAHEQLTLFYWGQNRLANAVAALTWPLRDADLNLWTVLVIHALAWHGLLWLVAKATRLWSRDGQPQAPVLAVYALLTALSHGLLTPEARYVLVAEGQPYALSGVATVAAWPWLTGAARQGELAQPQSIPRLFLAIAALTIGLGLNPGALALLVALALTAAASGFSRPRAGAVVALGVVLTAAWLGAAQLWGPAVTQPSYLTLRTLQQKAHLLQALGNLWRTLALPWLALALALMGGLAVVRHGRREARVLFLVLAALGATWLGLFASNRWVVINHLHFKYFFPVVLIALWLWGWAAAAAVRTWPNQRIERWTAVTLGAALLSAGVGAENRWTIAAFGSLAPAEQRLRQLPASPRPLLVGGDYWQVWPLVHRALAADRPVFGTAERGDARRGTLLQQLSATAESADATPWIAVCVGAPEATCQADLQNLTRRPWQLGPAQSCGRDCQWREALPGGPTWNCPPSLDFTREGAVPAWTTVGLGPAESHGRWTVGRRAGVRCWWPKGQPLPRALRLEVSGYVPAADAVQRVLAGDSAAPLATLTAQQPSARVEIALQRAEDGAIEASWQLPDAIAPADRGLGGDERRLGIAAIRGGWVY